MLKKSRIIFKDLTFTSVGLNLLSAFISKFTPKFILYPEKIKSGAELHVELGLPRVALARD